MPMSFHGRNGGGQEPEAVITFKVSAITKSENRIDMKTRKSAKMCSIFSTVKINMAAKPEVLITSLLL